MSRLRVSPRAPRSPARARAHLLISQRLVVRAVDARAARRAYRASVTGMDRKLGVLVKELDTLGLTNNTAIFGKDAKNVVHTNVSLFCYSSTRINL